MQVRLYICVSGERSVAAAPPPMSMSIRIAFDFMLFTEFKSSRMTVESITSKPFIAERHEAVAMLHASHESNRMGHRCLVSTVDKLNSSCSGISNIQIVIAEVFSGS
jgi:hypothetical protein